MDFQHVAAPGGALPFPLRVLSCPPRPTAWSGSAPIPSRGAGWSFVSVAHSLAHPGHTGCTRPHTNTPEVDVDKTRLWGGLAALVLLAHCGGEVGGEGEQAPPLERIGSTALTEQLPVTTHTFVAFADGRVEESFPDQHFAAGPLVADLSPWSEGYLNFFVSGVTGTVTRARLRLYVTDGTTDGPRLYRTTDSWFSEDDLTWSTRPALVGEPLGDLGAISSGTWVEYDVTAAVQGNGSHRFALIPTSGNGADFASREASDPRPRPQLVLTVASTPLPAACLPRADDFVDRHFTTGLEGYISQSEPDRSFINAPMLLVDGSPRLESFLNFYLYVSEGQRVRDAKLVLHATDGTSNGPKLYRAAEDWPRHPYSLTWNTHPTLYDEPVADTGAISSDSFVEYDLTGTVTGLGFYSFALVPDSSNGVDFLSSHNSSSFELSPRLFLTLETVPYCSYQGTGGTTGWVRHFGGVGGEQLQAMATVPSGGFVTVGLFGESSFPGGTGFALAHYASDGAFRWTRVVTTADARVTALAVTSQGHILAVGTYTGSPDLGTGALPPAPDDAGAGARALFIAKFSSSGTLEWARGFRATYRRGGTLEHWPVSPAAVATDAWGNLIVSGGFQGELALDGGLLFAGSQSVLPEEAVTGGFLAKFSGEGHHLWSRAFRSDSTGGPFPMPSRILSVATTGAGNLLVGGQLNPGADPGDGPVHGGGPILTSIPFLASYDGAGHLLWKRVFDTASGWVSNVRPLGTEGVAFSANLGLTFTFGGETYTTDEPTEPDITDTFLGTLERPGTDGWLRYLPGRIRQLATHEDGTISFSGFVHGEVDLGGGLVGSNALDRPQPMVARFSRSGAHRWSRVFDIDFNNLDDVPELHLAPQPGGSLVLGGFFSRKVELDGGRAYAASGESDLLFFQLRL